MERTQNQSMKWSKPVGPGGPRCPGGPEDPGVPD